MVSVQEMEHWAPQISCLRTKPSFSYLRFCRFVSCFSLFVVSARPGHIGGTPSGCSRRGPPGLRWPQMASDGLDFSAGRDEGLCEAIAAAQCDLKDATPL